MKRLLAVPVALALAVIAPTAVHAQELGLGDGDGGGSISIGLVTEYKCAADAGKSCTYKVTVADLTGFRITCTDSAAKPAPQVTIRGKGPATTCTIRSNGSYTYGNCMITGIPSDPDPIQIVAACQAQAGQSIF